MKPEDFFRDIVDPSLKKLTEWTGTPSDDRARVLVMAIAGQESHWEQRRQVEGPARSYWQFELFGGVVGLFNVVRARLDKVLVPLDIPAVPGTVHEAMAWNDTLACCMARLLLWTDPHPLPALGDHDAAYAYYIENWRPGMPHPGNWAQNYATAKALVRGEHDAESGAN